MLKVPAVGLDVIVMVNREDVSARLLADQILDSCLIGLDPIRPLSGHPIAPCVFRSLATDRVVQLFGKDGQPMVSIDGMDMPVEADEDGVLSPIGDFRYVKQTITLHPHTRPSAILLNDFGTRDELVLATPAENSPGRAIVGRYRSAGIGTAADVFTAAGGLRLKTMGRFGSAEYMLESLADRMWRARSTKAGWLGGILLFDHKAQAFSFSTYRSRRLKFQRTHECGDA
jgi:hypothetical protein